MMMQIEKWRILYAELDGIYTHRLMAGLLSMQPRKQAQQLSDKYKDRCNDDGSRPVDVVHDILQVPL